MAPPRLLRSASRDFVLLMKHPNSIVAEWSVLCSSQGHIPLEVRQHHNSSNTTTKTTTTISTTAIKTKNTNKIKNKPTNKNKNKHTNNTPTKQEQQQQQQQQCPSGQPRERGGWPDFHGLALASCTGPRPLGRKTDP
mmetsp:Transcript_65063/g.117039  ORF Transcript_65063/g.117039 Transcript_65063/m.117039 type:complete len:137 (-) Transcript_65063:644-1054(-)